MPKLFADSLIIQCPFQTDCNWYQLRDNIPQPVDTRELNVNNSIVLLGENANSYGEFRVLSSRNATKCYTVCPIDTGIV